MMVDPVNDNCRYLKIVHSRIYFNLINFALFVKWNVFFRREREKKKRDQPLNMKELVGNKNDF